jgi:hypothetical protein
MKRKLAIALTFILCGLAGTIAAFAASLNHGHAIISCNSVSYSFDAFPNKQNNTISLTVKEGSHVVTSSQFVFNGPSGSTTLAINLPAGSHTLEADSSWNTNGVKGSSQDRTTVSCGSTTTTTQTTTPKPPITNTTTVVVTTTSPTQTVTVSTTNVQTITTSNTKTVTVKSNPKIVVKKVTVVKKAKLPIPPKKTTVKPNVFPWTP